MVFFPNINSCDTIAKEAWSWPWQSSKFQIYFQSAHSLENTRTYKTIKIIGFIEGSSHYNRVQSAYWRAYSTETAIVRLLNDVCWAANDGCRSLVLLDLSAAFDCINLNREETSIATQCESGYYEAPFWARCCAHFTLHRPLTSYAPNGIFMVFLHGISIHEIVVGPCNLVCC